MINSFGEPSIETSIPLDQLEEDGVDGKSNQTETENGISVGENGDVSADRFLDDNANVAKNDISKYGDSTLDNDYGSENGDGLAIDEDMADEFGLPSDEQENVNEMMNGSVPATQQNNVHVLNDDEDFKDDFENAAKENLFEQQPIISINT